MRAVRLGSTVREWWLRLWFHAWSVIVDWLEMVRVEGNFVGLWCWYTSLRLVMFVVHIIVSGSPLHAAQQPPTTFPHVVLLFCQLPIYFQCLLAGVRQQNQEQASRPPSCCSATILQLTQHRPHRPPRPSPAVRAMPH